MTPSEVQLVCEHHLKQMEACFKPHCRLTLLMRTPGNDECELLFTRDELPEVIRAIGRFQLRDEQIVTVGKEARP